MAEVDGDRAAGAQHADRLGERGARIDEVVERAREQDDVEAGVREREVLGQGAVALVAGLALADEWIHADEARVVGVVVEVRRPRLGAAADVQDVAAQLREGGEALHVVAVADAEVVLRVGGVADLAVVLQALPDLPLPGGPRLARRGEVPGERQAPVRRPAARARDGVALEGGQRRAAGGAGEAHGPVRR